jgi:hypothetical protein
LHSFENGVESSSGRYPKSGADAALIR